MEKLRLQRSADAMGATFSIVLYGVDPDPMESTIAAAFDEVRRLDAMLSNFIPTSEWSRLNRLAGLGPVKVPEEVCLLLAACQEYSRLTDGAFDITVRPLVDAWGFSRGSGRLPDDATLTSAKSRVGYGNLLLNTECRTVEFGRPGMVLDSGGIGKGYAVDRMVGILRQGGFDTGLVTGSASSIYGLGIPPAHSAGWPVDIPDPLSPRRALYEASLIDKALSTTGTCVRSFRREGRSYSHIVDPRTGCAAGGMLQVSVISPHAMDGEAWAKAFFVNGRAWTEAHKPAGFRVFMCDAAPEHPCAWV